MISPSAAATTGVPSWRRNINRIVRPSFRARIGKRVEQLIRPHANDRNDEIQRADKSDSRSASSFAVG